MNHADAVVLSRIQFAFTLGYHILWPAFSIGIAAFLVYLNAAWVRTRRPVYLQLLNFWTRIFGLAFGMGVVTGVVISYEIATNWAGFALATADVLAPLFTFEILTAFFLEAGFIGIMLFGRGRVSDKVHLGASAIVAAGTVLSAFWILAANSWMQTPQGFEVIDGRFVATDWMKVIFNPSFPYRFVHMVLASYVTGCFVVIGVSAFYLVRGLHVDFSCTALSVCLWMALGLVPAQIIAGDMHGLNTREHQPMKLAAIEARWDTARDAPLNLLALPDAMEERNAYAIEIPHLGSLILTHELDGEIKGLKEVPADRRPPVAVVFFAFRIMVGCGMIMLAVALGGVYLRFSGRLYSTKWFHYVCMLTTPLGFIAILAGWTVTEVGRQPYVIYGQLLTADAASPVLPEAIASTLIAFFLIYNMLLLGFFWYAGRLVWRGPTAIQDPVKPIGFGTRVGHA